MGPGGRAAARAIVGQAPPVSAMRALAVVAMALALGGCSGGGAPPAEAPAEARGAAGAEPRPRPAFSRGPYLTRVSRTGARLRWVTAGGGAVELAARAADGTPARAQAGRDGGTLTGLRPGTWYRWTATIAGSAAGAGFGRPRATCAGPSSSWCSATTALPTTTPGTSRPSPPGSARACW